MKKVDRTRVLAEIKTKLEELKLNKRQNEFIVFGINNLGVFRDGTADESSQTLRIFEEHAWKTELGIYCSSGMILKAVELFKSEITSVVSFPELGEDAKFELRYYSLSWKDDVAKEDLPSIPEDDTRNLILPKLLSDYDMVCGKYLYVFVEMKPLDISGWKSCCVCEIMRANSIQCTWNSELYFCSDACQSIAMSQHEADVKKQNKKDVKDVTEEDDGEYVKIADPRMEALRAHLETCVKLS